MKIVESIPSPLRTFEALRSLGYDINSSISDIIDNSITKSVSADNIHVILKRRKGKFICRIIDNGTGMSKEKLSEAMRIGTETSYENQDLGKFGMGLKTASLSHCNILTVISQSKKGILSGYRWDMKRIKDTNKWALLELNNKEIGNFLAGEKLLIPKSGTIVFWDDLVVLNNEYNSYTSPQLAENYFYRLLGNLKLYLEMTFHRFLDGTLGPDKKIKINVNGAYLIPWDPFCRDEKNTDLIALNEKNSELNVEGYKNKIYIEACVLPNKEAFSSEAAWKRAKGVLSWNDSQGYYIYRANRLVRFGGWHGTKSKDEHDKLARINIDIHPELDDLFRITVNKNKVQFPEILYYHLKTKINPIVIKKAKQKYSSSNDGQNINNQFRSHNQKFNVLSKELIKENKIRMNTDNSNRKNNFVSVENPSGTWLSNKINEFLKYGSEKDFEIVSAEVENGYLWKILCNSNERFKVIVNNKSSFYSRIYNTDNSKSVTGLVDAIIFSLAFAELYTKNEENMHLLNTFKTVCAKVLEKLTKEEMI